MQLIQEVLPPIVALVTGLGFDVFQRSSRLRRKIEKNVELAAKLDGRPVKHDLMALVDVQTRLFLAREEPRRASEQDLVDVGRFLQVFGLALSFLMLGAAVKEDALLIQVVGKIGLLIFAAGLAMAQRGNRGRVRRRTEQYRLALPDDPFEERFWPGLRRRLTRVGALLTRLPLIRRRLSPGPTP